MTFAAVAIGTTAVSLGLQGYKMYQGNKQRKEGENALANLKRPTYKIPQELYDNLSDAERRQVEGLTPEQKSQWVKNVERSQQNSLKASAERKGGLLGLQASMSAENDSYSNLVSMDATARKQSELQKQANIERARTAIVGAKNNRFNINQGYYQQDLTSAQGLIGAGNQNFMQGLSGMGQTLNNAATLAANNGQISQNQNGQTYKVDANGNPI